MKKVIFTLLLVALASSCLIGSCLLGCLGGHKCGGREGREGRDGRDGRGGHCCLGGKCGGKENIKQHRYFGGKCQGKESGRKNIRDNGRDSGRYSGRDNCRVNEQNQRKNGGDYLQNHKKESYRPTPISPPTPSRPTPTPQNPLLPCYAGTGSNPQVRPLQNQSPSPRNSLPSYNPGTVFNPQVRPLPNQGYEANQNGHLGCINSRGQNGQEQSPQGAYSRSRDNVQAQSSFQNNGQFGQNNGQFGLENGCGCDANSGDFK